MKTFLRLRKTYMTLLETLIAVSLLSVILVFVFGFFRELTELTRMAEESQKESFHTRYLETRFGFIFERIVNESETTTRTFAFYTEPPKRDFSASTSLIMTFNNEVRRDPAFSGDVLGRIYVDLNHRLCLAIWPLHIDQPHNYLQEEVLLDNVVSVNYSFYAAPEKVSNKNEITSGKIIDPGKKTPERDKWHQEEWAKTYEEMPSIVKLDVEVAENPKDLNSYSQGRISTKTLTFSYVLPSSKNPVHFPLD